jgi:hypothetical protein
MKFKKRKEKEKEKEKLHRNFDKKRPFYSDI